MNKQTNRNHSYSWWGHTTVKHVGTNQTGQGTPKLKTKLSVFPPSGILCKWEDRPLTKVCVS